MFKNTLMLLTASAFGMIIFASCSQTDVIGNGAVKSFNEVLNTIPESITSDELNLGWSLETPDKSARFIWGKDYSKNSMHDIMLEFDAQPFIDAGLDVNKLPENIVVINDRLMVGKEINDKELKYDAEITPFTSFEQILKNQRDDIGYHASLDHFNVNVGNENKFEWAKDMSKNDKDIVFALDPQPFIDAGVKVENVEGWKFAKVETMDSRGKAIEVDKLLKPFDLK